MRRRPRVSWALLEWLNSEGCRLAAMEATGPWAAKRAKTYRGQFSRLQARRGPQKAICAAAASILTAIHHMLKNGTYHQDLGVDCFDRRSPESKGKRLARQIAKLGHEATLQPAAKAA